MFAQSKCGAVASLRVLFLILNHFASRQLLNLHGKTLVCYVIALLIAYIILAIVQFHSESKLEKCYEAGVSLSFASTISKHS